MSTRSRGVGVLCSSSAGLAIVGSIFVGTVAIVLPFFSLLRRQNRFTGQQEKKQGRKKRAIENFCSNVRSRSKQMVARLLCYDSISHHVESLGVSLLVSDKDSHQPAAAPSLCVHARVTHTYISQLG